MFNLSTDLQEIIKLINLGILPKQIQFRLTQSEPINQFNWQTIDQKSHVLIVYCIVALSSQIYYLIFTDRKTLFMPTPTVQDQKHQEHDNADNAENHGMTFCYFPLDDCDDCRRQRAQNEALIEIYEKLQDVDKKTSTVKQGLHKHKSIAYSDKQKVESFSQKIAQINKNKKNQQQAQFQQMGYHLFSDLLQKSIKSESQKQNTRLKEVIRNIYAQRKDKIDAQTTVFRHQENQNKTDEQISENVCRQNHIPKFEQTQQSSKWFETANPKLSSRGSRLPSRNLSQAKNMSSDSSVSGNTSTQSTFNMTKRKTFEKKDFEDLNLWLFEDNKNERLQQELYSPKLRQNPESLSLSLGGHQASNSQNRNHRKLSSLSRYGNINDLNGLRSSKMTMDESKSILMGTNSPKRKGPQTYRENVRNQNLEKSIQKINGNKQKGPDLGKRAGQTQDNSSPPKKYFQKRQRGSVLPAILKK